MGGNDKYILVTGGAGYIGSHACKALASAGYLPVSFDNLINGHGAAVRWGPLEKGDLLDRQAIDDVLSRYRPSAIMHFAAFAYVGESTIDPGKYYENNVTGSLNLIQAAVDHDIRRFVFSSSCATYGIPDTMPITEETRQHPINPYGWTKFMTERILADFADARQLRSVILRYFNAAGADPDGEIGEVHDPETHLIPLVLDAAAGRRDAITVFGNDYDTPDGTCIRDYVHVCDIADAHVRALRALDSGGASAAYNIGAGSGHSVSEVINAARDVTGLDVPFTVGPRRPGDPAMLVADASRIHRELAWSPAITHLKDIIATAWAWQQSGGFGQQ